MQFNIWEKKNWNKKLYFYDLVQKEVKWEWKGWTTKYCFNFIKCLVLCKTTIIYILELNSAIQRILSIRTHKMSSIGSPIWTTLCIQDFPFNRDGVVQRQQQQHNGFLYINVYFIRMYFNKKFVVNSEQRRRFMWTWWGDDVFNVNRIWKVQWRFVNAYL